MVIKVDKNKPLSANELRFVDVGVINLISNIICRNISY